MDAITASILPGARDKVPPRGIVRKAKRSERSDLVAHLLRLSPEDRYRRFCGAVSDAFITRYALGDTAHPRVVVGYWVNGVMRGAGEIFFPVPGSTGEIAEIALSVEAPFQNQGIGTSLVRRLLTIARHRALGLVRLVSQRDNRRVRALALKFGAQMSPRMDGELEMFIEPPPATYVTFLEALLDDGEAVRATLSSAWWNTTAQLARLATQTAREHRFGSRHELPADDPRAGPIGVGTGSMTSGRRHPNRTYTGNGPRPVESSVPR